MSFAENLKNRIASLDDRIAAIERDIANMRIGVAEMCGERAAFLHAIEMFQETVTETGPAPRLNIREAVYDQLHDNGPMTIEEIAKAIGRYPSQVRSNLDALAKDGKVEVVNDHWKITMALHVPLSAQAQAES